jgi:hypothetical protein
MDEVVFTGHIVAIKIGVLFVFDVKPLIDQ